MSTPAVTFYREHRRAVEALAVSKLFAKSGSESVPDRFFETNVPLRDLARRTEALNIFSALGVADREIRHSRFLAWLLNPKGTHGFGAQFLAAFLGHVCSKDGKALRAPQFAIDETEVICEADRVDLLIINRPARFLCAIENKIRIEQGEGQLTRYRRKLEAEYRDWTCRFVFLTLQGERPADPAYRPLSYIDVLAVLGRVAPAKTDDAATALGLLLSDYRAFVRARGELSGTSNILEILHLTRTELKHSHFLAWLLSARASHGLRDAFARFLLVVLKRKGAFLPVDPAGIDLADIIVRRELANIDVLLVSERHRLVVGIENKIGAAESKTQLADYDRFLRRHFAGDHLLRVFLDLKGRAPSHSDYVGLTYEDLLPFFDDQIAIIGRIPSTADATGTLIRHYVALLTDHLWIKRGLRWELPASLQACCDQLAAKERAAGAALIGMITSWQRRLGLGLEDFLYETADRCFGTCFRFTWGIWFSFIPPEIDAIPVLRAGGADPAFPGRMLIYQFRVLPFGDAGTDTRGIFLDVKLIKARTDHQAIKARFHEAALANPLFNAVKRGATVPTFDPLLKYEVCAFDEAVSCDESELRRRISNRMERFARSIHPDIVDFFKVQAGAVAPRRAVV